jgi:putative effector of murein hydrolase LrgA (UPF0299 family)
VLSAFLILLGCQLLGDVIRQATNLQIPGAVIGMFLLAAMLALTGGRPRAVALVSLSRMAETLIEFLGLLLVPAGVGVIAEKGLLTMQWLPILAAVVGSTVLGTAVTGWVMHRTIASRRKSMARRSGAPAKKNLS